MNANENANTEDIAVVGLGCRVAGGITSPEELWSFLLAKGDASGDIPPMRWEPYYSHDARTVKAIKTLPSRGYFLDNLEKFDASFFGISGREAELMDPQQRISVEVAWEALEDAGIAPQSLAGTNTAVYMGVGTDDYSRLLFEDLADIEAWTGIGTAYCGVPNRISYLFDLNGPSFAVDAACASSLVAIHNARQALLSGETSLAIAGGVNALIVPGQFKVLSHAGAISREGQCMSFDDEAHGYGRGEGVGIVILKRLGDALRTAIAHDGRTNGIMAPNRISQEKVARDALRAAKVEARSISYVEAHATSTPAGDPVEISAIASVYGHGRFDIEPCLVGSIKPNIGHLESGAGALGFIKSVLAVSKSYIPPQTNLHTLNSKIDWNKAGIKIVRDEQQWKQDNMPRRAAICSYGYGGTVSHAIIENTPPYQISEGSESSASSISESVLLLLSAPQASRIPFAVNTLADWFSTDIGSRVPLDTVATTLGVRRSHHAHRVAVVANHATEAPRLLKSFAEGSPDAEFVTSARVSPEAANPGPVWVFSGHGAHWKGMGVELMEQDPIFAQTIHEIDDIVQDELGFSAATLLQDGGLGTTDHAHVLTFAMHVGLCAVLKSKGVFPSAIIGHSLGEVAAAVCAGALTLREGALIVCKKAKLLQQVMGTGSMVLLQTPFDAATSEIGSTRDIAVAIDTSPNTCVVSGKTDVVERFSAAWIKRGLPVRSVNSDVAFHSPMLDCLKQDLYDQLEGEIYPHAPTIPLYSTSVPFEPRSQATRDAKYWVDNMINPVRLTSAITAAADDGFRVFVEVSSHPIICQAINETLEECALEDFVVIPTLIRNRPPRRSVLLSIGKLHCHGVPVHMNNLFTGEWSQSVPKTQWKHETFWKSVAVGRKSNQETHDVESHTLLGHRTLLFGTDVTMWKTYLDDTMRPYPNLHPILGTEIIPAAVLLNTFLTAGGTTSIADIALKVPVSVMPARDIQVMLKKDRVQISSRLVVNEDPESQPWITHTVGKILSNVVAIPDTIVIDEIKQRTRKSLVPTFAVDYLASLGVTDMGFPWVVTEHLAADNEMLVRVAIAPDLETLPWNSESLAPFLDAATSVGAAIFHEQPGIRMPSHIDRVSFRAGMLVPREGYIHVKRTSIPLTVDIVISDIGGNIVAEVAAMTLSELEGTEGVSSSMESLVHEVAWPAAPLADFATPTRHIIFIGPPGRIIKDYRKTLEATTKIKLTEVAGPELLPLVEDHEGTVIIFVPGEIESDEQVPQLASDSCAMLVATVKVVASLSPSMKLYAISQNAANGKKPTSLAHGALFGLARIIETEHSDIWGALLDVEDSAFPLQALKYVSGADVVRVVDGIARIGRLRSLPKSKLYGSKPKPITLPTMEGTYVITGGTGDLGLEVASWMITKGARRLVLVSRRKLPARHLWGSHPTKVTEKVLQFEKEGSTVHVVSLDMSLSDASSHLKLALDQLSLPPVKGVVHAAGILEDQFIMTSDRAAFDRVLGPKIKGAMALNEAFPPNTLDFFVLFSSCGQHFQFAGSASYASGNSFLDALAQRRRDLGDNAIAFQWTCWRGLGMAADAENLNAEMEIKGITDVTSEDAFKAWEYLAQYDMASAVIVRARPIAQGAILASPIVADIVVRHATSIAPAEGVPPVASLPTTGPELTAHLSAVICACVAKTLKINADDIDTSVALVEMGLDSVMTIQLRKHLQDALQVKVPPNLIWGHPSVGHMVKWFTEELSK
ncbi:6-methylsalicylic acid synthase [Tricladium varicosporioides]|nr:6-methylsalicylic acid synthase [Hymenoscyphus varicosporioides]